MRFVLLVLCAALLLGACIPPAPAPRFNHDDGWLAVEQSFADLGPGELAKAHCIASRESGYNPYAVNGQYRGVFQLGHNYDGTISVTNDGDVWNPYTNAMAARVAYDASGWRPWSTAGGC